MGDEMVSESNMAFIIKSYFDDAQRMGTDGNYLHSFALFLKKKLEGNINLWKYRVTTSHSTLRICLNDDILIEAPSTTLVIEPVFDSTEIIFNMEVITSQGGYTNILNHRHMVSLEIALDIFEDILSEYNSLRSSQADFAKIVFSKTE